MLHKKAGIPHRTQPRSKNQPRILSPSAVFMPDQSHAEPDLGPGFGVLLTQQMRRGRQLPTHIDECSDDRVDLG